MAQKNKGSARPSTKKAAGKRKRRRRVLHGLSDIRRYFHRNEDPIYFISATNFNLLGMDEWIGHFTYINHIDSFDGQHPNVFIPKGTRDRTFNSIEEINNYLLEQKSVVDLIRSKGPGGKALFLFFDDRTEAICKDLGLQVCFPPARLREEVDNKVNTTRIADRAGVKSVPNVLAKVDSYETLRKVSKRLGPDVVIQTAFGDSGHTTFFISNEKDWNRHADEIMREPEVKIMKRIRCRGSALEACATRHGTIVGPLMTELVGFKELTPYRGGWCGNEMYADTFTQKVRRQARDATFRIGQELWKLGYKGYFEVDFLTDLDSGRVYLGELNPRITGASSMTNLSAFAHADVPLFLFHLLEWMDVDYELDIEALNERWADAENIDSWSQMVIKHTRDEVDRVSVAPRSGVWEMDSAGQISFLRLQTHRRTVQQANRAFYLRISGSGDYRYLGADLGILTAPGRFMTDDFKLNSKAKAWLKAILGQYQAEHYVAATDPAPISVGQFKML